MRTSRDTASKQVPLVYDKIVWKSRSRNLDVGGGPWNEFTKALVKDGVENLIYDPYNRPDNHNRKVMSMIARRKADTCTVSNVLNIIQFKKDRIALLRQVRQWVRKGGKVYITIYEGDRSGVGKILRTDSFQQNTKLGYYLDTVRRVFKNATMYRGIITATI